MAFTEYNENSYDFSEITENDKQILVTNNLGRTALAREIVYLDGYIGEVMEYGGIADSATGRINIDPERTVRTAQMEATDTFVSGQNVYFLSGGSSAAGEVRATPEAGSVPYGKCIGFGGTGGAHTYVEVRPFSIAGESKPGSGVKVREIVVPTGSHGAGTPVVDTGIPVGSKIIDVVARTTTANASGTATVSDGTNAITNAIVMAVLDVQTRASTIDTTYATITSAGVTVTANATGDAGIVYIYYI
jgi:hypothetical protein